jgi:hypothetical protein
MARRNAHGRLQVESLEGRVVPAGNVTAALIGDTLHIRGDDADNVVTASVPIVSFSALGGDDVGSRLFAVLADGSNSIVELDPATGEELNRFPAPEPVSAGPDGLAFDGTSLFYINGFGSVQLWELDPDTGAVLDADEITAGTQSFDGLAALGGNVYILDYGASDIIEFDPATDTVTNVLDVDALNPGYFLVGGLAGITGPDALVATSDFGASGVVEIDPATGLVTADFVPIDFYYGLAVVDGEIHLGSPNGFIDVYSRAGDFERTITVPSDFQVVGFDTLVNGGTDPVVFPVPANIDIRMGPGSDVSQVFNVSLAGNLSVKESGSGNDQVFVSQVTLGGSLTVDTAAGDDFVYVVSTFVTGSVRAVTGSGSDLAVFFGVAVDGSLTIDTGEGNDFAEVDFSVVGGSLTLLTRQGDDIAVLFGIQAGRTTIDTAEGADSLYLFDLSTGSLAVTLGAGADLADVFGVSVADGLGVIDGGPGSDVFIDEGDNSGFTTRKFE